MQTYPVVKKVKPLDDYNLMLTFSNGETRVLNMKPHLGKGIFRELKDVAVFNTVHISFDTVEWDNDADFDPEDLYTLSKKIKKYPSSSLIIKAAETKIRYGKKKNISS